MPACTSAGRCTCSTAPPARARALTAARPSSLSLCNSINASTMHFKRLASPRFPWLWTPMRRQWRRLSG
eukprot:13471935-Alexandrium_andersonii.AAC.1